MTSHINIRFRKSYSKLSTETKMIAKKQYKLFKKNPYHTSLHFKMLDYVFVLIIFIVLGFVALKQSSYKFARTL